MNNILRTTVICIFCLVIVSSCKNKNEGKLKDKTTQILESNKLIDDPENKGEKMLLGLITHEDFKSETLFPWMYENFELYKPNPTTCLQLKKELEGVSIKAFMGTWCEDSQREIPHLYKILNISGFEYDSLQMVAVSHEKDTPEGYEKDLDIEFVPTFIFYKQGKELGRFVEYVQGESLEQDIFTIITGKPYTPAYAE